MSNLNESQELKALLEEKETLIESLEKSLTESERTIRSIVSRLPLGLMVLTSEYKIEAVNNRVVEMFGYVPEDLRDQSIDFLFPDIKSLDDFKPNSEIKALTKRKKQLVTVVSVNSARISGAPRHFIHIHDVTERARVEQLKRDFVSMLSHDLRSPIASLQILLSMLEDGAYGKLDTDGQTRVSSAKKSTEKLVNMISELLDLESMEEGLFELSKEKCAFAEIIDGAIDDVYDLCFSKDIEIVSELEDQEAACDPSQIRRVVVNLLSNAIKFSPHGTEIRVSARAQEDALRVSVRDQGPGIAEKDIEVVFDRYRKADPEDSKGSGLGLAICKAIVEAHDGLIGAESELDNGSEFWFTVPMR